MLIWRFIAKMTKPSPKGQVFTNWDRNMFISWIEPRIGKRKSQGRHTLMPRLPVSLDFTYPPTHPPPPSPPERWPLSSQPKQNPCGNIQKISSLNSPKLSGRHCLPIKANKSTEMTELCIMAQNVFWYILLINFSRSDPVQIVLSHSVPLVAVCPWPFTWGTEEKGYRRVGVWGDPAHSSVYSLQGGNCSL